SLQGFLEHISLIMDADGAADTDAVSIMTLHSAKGLEFDTVFLPGWEDGLFPHQRALDDQGKAGLEEERRLAHVGITRARRRVKIFFATNRRMHGMWQTTAPSRFLDELPEAHVEVTESKGGFGWGGVTSRFDAMESFGSNYETPGWQRAHANRAKQSGFDEPVRHGNGAGPRGVRRLRRRRSKEVPTRPRAARAASLPVPGRDKTNVARLRTDERTARRVADLFSECFDPDDTASAVYEADGGWTAALYSGRPFDRDALRAIVTSEAGKLAARALTFERIGERDWIAASLAGLPPVVAGRFVVYGRHDRA